MTDTSALLARVYGYPYPAPADDAADPVPSALPDGQVPVLAFGANASRAILAAKLADAAAGVLSLAATVEGVDTVYSAHVSPYGAIPATLHASPGTVLGARVLVVARDVLVRLDATEPNYVREPLAGDVRVQVVGLGAVAAHAYRSRHGPLVLEGAPVALEAVAVRGRRLPARGQRDVHAAIRDLLEPGADLDGFVLAGVRDPAVRARRTAILRGLGEPARGPGGAG